MSSDAVQTLSPWALSAGNHPIDLYGSSDPGIPTSERPVLLIGGVHGDEPEGVEVAKKLLVMLTQRSSPFPWRLIPCLNPDGYNRSPRQRMNSNGVDLNRNFPTPDWSPEFRTPRYFPGPFSSSEPEVRALIDLIDRDRPRIIIHFHSDKTPCHVYSGERGRRIAEFLEVQNGYTAKADIGYPTPGSLGQYGALVAKIPVLCLEEQEGIPIASVWPHYEKALETLFYSSDLLDQL